MIKKVDPAQIVTALLFTGEDDRVLGKESK